MADDAFKPHPPSKNPAPEEEKSEIDIAEEKQAASISELESELAAPLTPSAPPVKKPSREGMNLSSLRDRVLHESLEKPSPVLPSMPPPVHAEAPEVTAPAKAVAPSATPTPTTSIVPPLAVEVPAEPLPIPTPEAPKRKGTSFKLSSSQPAIAPPPEIMPPETPEAPAVGAGPDMHALEKKEEAKNPFTGTVRPLRTFRDDIAQVVERRKISLVSALAAEEDQRSTAKAAAESKTQKRLNFSPGAFFMLGMSSVFLVVGAVVIFGYFAFFGTKEITGVPQTSLPSLIFSELQTQIDVTNMHRTELMNALMAEKDRISVRLGAITAVYPIFNNNGTYQLVTASQFFEALESRAPLPLVRALEPFFMFGIHEFDGNEPFFIFKTEAYENAYAGMIEWEPLMSLDLAPLFGRVSLTQTLSPRETPPVVEPAPIIPVASSTTGTSTGTSSASSASATTTQTSDGFIPIGSPDAPVANDPGPQFASARFEDAVIRNKEVRVLKNPEGKIVLLYSFIDPSTIIITTNEYTFIEVLTRYASRRF